MLCYNIYKHKYETDYVIYLFFNLYQLSKITLYYIYIYIYIYFNLKHYVNAVNMEILTMGQYDNSS